MALKVEELTPSGQKLSFPKLNHLGDPFCEVNGARVTSAALLENSLAQAAGLDLAGRFDLRRRLDVVLLAEPATFQPLSELIDYVLKIPVITNFPQKTKSVYETEVAIRNIRAMKTGLNALNLLVQLSTENPSRQSLKREARRKARTPRNYPIELTKLKREKLNQQSRPEEEAILYKQWKKALHTHFEDVNSLHQSLKGKLDQLKSAK